MYAASEGEDMLVSCRMVPNLFFRAVLFSLFAGQSRRRWSLKRIRPGRAVESHTAERNIMNSTHDSSRTCFIVTETSQILCFFFASSKLYTGFKREADKFSYYHFALARRVICTRYFALVHFLGRQTFAFFALNAEHLDVAPSDWLLIWIQFNANLILHTRKKIV